MHTVCEALFFFFESLLPKQIGQHMAFTPANVRAAGQPNGLQGIYALLGHSVALPATLTVDWRRQTYRSSSTKMSRRSGSLSNALSSGKGTELGDVQVMVSQSSAVSSLKLAEQLEQAVPSQF